MLLVTTTSFSPVAIGGDNVSRGLHIGGYGAPERQCNSFWRTVNNSDRAPANQLSASLIRGFRTAAVSNHHKLQILVENNMGKRQFDAPSIEYNLQNHNLVSRSHAAQLRHSKTVRSRIFQPFIPNSGTHFCSTHGKAVHVT